MAEKPVVSIVTGSSRGAGKGIAVALGSHGCIVYVTGRSEKEGDGEVPGTIYATAREVTHAGGQGIAVRCDHADDAQDRRCSTKSSPSRAASTSLSTMPVGRATR